MVATIKKSKPHLIVLYQKQINEHKSKFKNIYIILKVIGIRINK